MAGTVPQEITWIHSHGYIVPGNAAAQVDRRIAVYGASSHWTNLQWYPAVIQMEVRDPNDPW